MEAVHRNWLRVKVLVGVWLERGKFVRRFGEDVLATIEFLSFVVSMRMHGLDLVVGDADDVAMVPLLGARPASGRVGIVSWFMFLCVELWPLLLNR